MAVHVYTRVKYSNAIDDAAIKIVEALETCKSYEVVGNQNPILL